MTVSATTIKSAEIVLKQSIGWNTRKKADFPRIIIDDTLKPAEFLIEIERDENKTYYLNIIN